MTDFTKSTLGFIQYTRAWYAKKTPLMGNVREEITFGYFGDGDSPTANATVKWVALSSDRLPVPQLEMFDDAWALLPHIQKLQAKMAEYSGLNIIPSVFCNMLEEAGFKDITPLVQPPSSWDVLHRFGDALNFMDADEKWEVESYDDDGTTLYRVIYKIYDDPHRGLGHGGLVASDIQTEEEARAIASLPKLVDLLLTYLELKNHEHRRHVNWPAFEQDVTKALEPLLRPKQ